LNGSLVLRGKTGARDPHGQQVMSSGTCLAIQDGSYRERQMLAAADAGKQIYLSTSKPGQPDMWKLWHLILIWY